MSDRAPAGALRKAILSDFESLMQTVAQWRMVEVIDTDITMPQARCLFLVSVRPGISVSALATHLHVGLSAASGLIDRMVANGYLERREDPDDRRQQRITLSSLGRQVVDRFHELSAERLDDLLAGVTLEELRALHTGVAALEREARAYAARLAKDPNPERTTA